MIKNIRCVEIEIHSFCNRKCNWCPNADIDRTFMEKLDPRLYRNILTELKKESYSGVISFSRYNEPMAAIKLLKQRVNQAKDILPKVKLVSNTNGDYLTQDNLKGLRIDELTIMDYDCKGLKSCLQKLTDIEASIHSIEYPYIKARYGSIEILYFVDWPKNTEIVDRGGLIGNHECEINWKNMRGQRQHACLEPLYFIGIDFTGDVTPCCQIRSDFKQHHDYILGNVTTSKLNEILHDKAAADFRYNALHNKYDNPKHPCKYCQKDCGRYTRDEPGIEMDVMV